MNRSAILAARRRRDEQQQQQQQQSLSTSTSATHSTFTRSTVRNSVSAANVSQSPCIIRGNNPSSFETSTKVQRQPDANATECQRTSCSSHFPTENQHPNLASSSSHQSKSLLKINTSDSSSLLPSFKPPVTSPSTSPSSSSHSSSFSSSTSIRYFSVMYCQRSLKKHKTYLDGLLLITENKSLLLKSVPDNKIVSKRLMSNTQKLEIGSEFLCGNWEGEILELVKEEEYLSGRLFLRSDSAGRSMINPLSSPSSSKPPKGHSLLNVATSKQGLTMLGRRRLQQAQEYEAAQLEKQENEDGEEKSKMQLEQQQKSKKRGGGGNREACGSAGPCSLAFSSHKTLQDLLQSDPNALVLNTPFINPGSTEISTTAAAVPSIELVKGRKSDGGGGAKANKQSTYEVPVIVDPHLSRHLRPHQREGVQFLYDCIMGHRCPNSNLSSSATFSSASSFQDICGAILADAMGLGKSLQSITLIHTLLKRGPRGIPVFKKACVICPSTLVQNWKIEFNKWLGSVRLSVATIDMSLTKEDQKLHAQAFQSGQAVSVLILSYEMFRKWGSEYIAPIESCLFVADEGHRLKNCGGNKTISALHSIRSRSRIILTGTPIQNDLLEYYSMCSFVNPNILGSLHVFKQTYEIPINHSRDKCATLEQKIMGEARSEELTRLTKMFVLRRNIDLLVKYLPLRREIIIFLPCTSLQIFLYHTLLKSQKIKRITSNSNLTIHDAATLQCINLLKKLVNHPQLIYEQCCGGKQRGKGSKGEEDEEGEEEGLGKREEWKEVEEAFPDRYREMKQKYQATTGLSAKMNIMSGLLPLEDSSKFECLFHILKSIDDENKRVSSSAAAAAAGAQNKEGSTPSSTSNILKFKAVKVVIVSNYRTTLNLIESLLIHFQWGYYRLDGSTPSDLRQQYVDQFNSSYTPNRFIFLLSSRAGGLGLSLIGASHLILFDPDWNPSNDHQAMARIWRDGQTSNVVIYRLLSTGTIDEKILQRQLRKQEVSLSVVDQQDVERSFTRESLKEIFKFQYYERGKMIGVGRDMQNSDDGEQVCQSSAITGTCETIALLASKPMKLKKGQSKAKASSASASSSSASSSSSPSPSIPTSSFQSLQSQSYRSKAELLQALSTSRHAWSSSPAVPSQAKPESTASVKLGGADWNWFTGDYDSSSLVNRIQSSSSSDSSPLSSCSRFSPLSYHQMADPIVALLPSRLVTDVLERISDPKQMTPQEIEAEQNIVAGKTGVMELNGEIQKKEEGEGDEGQEATSVDLFPLQQASEVNWNEEQEIEGDVNALESPSRFCGSSSQSNIPGCSSSPSSFCRSDSVLPSSPSMNPCPRKRRRSIKQEFSDDNEEHRQLEGRHAGEQGKQSQGGEEEAEEEELSEEVEEKRGMDFITSSSVILNVEDDEVPEELEEKSVLKRPKLASRLRRCIDSDDDEDEDEECEAFGDVQLQPEPSPPPTAPLSPTILIQMEIDRAAAGAKMATIQGAVAENFSDASATEK